MSTTIVDGKICSICQETKPLTNFPKYNLKQRLSFCRSCKRGRATTAKEKKVDDPGTPDQEVVEKLSTSNYPKMFGAILEMIQQLAKDESERDMIYFRKMFNDFLEKYESDWEHTPTPMPSTEEYEEDILPRKVGKR